MSYTSYTTSPTDVLRQQSIMTQVYAWMTAGLLVTGAVAMFFANQVGLITALFSNVILLIGLIVVQFAMVFAISAAISRLSPAVATALFLAYAALNGVTFSVIFLVYTTASIASTFFITAGMFGAMSAYGYLTKRDLSGWGSFLFMALIGLILASIVNIFWQNSVLYWITTFAGVLIFVGLTAYDTQKIRNLAMQVRDEVGAGRVAIYGALNLYLDFINLFLYLLRLFGSRR